MYFVYLLACNGELFYVGLLLIFSARCNIYISRLCYVSVRLSVRLSVTEVHWRIIASLGSKFRSQFTAHCGRGAWGSRGKGSSPGRVEGSSRAMLATARRSCLIFCMSCDISCGHHHLHHVFIITCDIPHMLYNYLKKTVSVTISTCFYTKYV